MDLAAGNPFHRAEIPVFRERSSAGRRIKRDRIVTRTTPVRQQHPARSGRTTGTPHHPNIYFVKLAIITETFPPEINGVAMTFGVIASELGRRGHALTIYRPRRPDLADAATHPEYQQVALPGFSIPRYNALRLGFPAGRRLRALWRAERPDLVHVATEGPLGASAVSAARSLGIPVTSSFHTNFHAYARHYGMPLLNRTVLRWLRHFHNRTLRTFVPTEELRTELRALGFRDLALLSRGVDTRQFGSSRRSAARRAQWGAGEDDPVVVHAGRMAAEKNYPLLFECYNAMRAANPRCVFILVGDGPVRRSLEKLWPHARFTGFVTRDELAEHYASADIYIHASLTETFGNVLTEAMASGLAVAGFNYAAARQFIQNGVNGLAVSNDDPLQLVRAAALLAGDSDLRSRLRAAAAASVERQSWASVIGGFEQELLELAAPGRMIGAPPVSAPAPACDPV